MEAVARGIAKWNDVQWSGLSLEKSSPAEKR